VQEAVVGVLCGPPADDLLSEDTDRLRLLLDHILNHLIIQHQKLGGAQHVLIIPCDVARWRVNRCVHGPVLLGV
jgi:hypothetical protein